MTNVSIQGDFWANRLEINGRRAIFHQWDQLTASGCIENFRVAAGLVEGVHHGWFFADSDAYKWLEAAVRISVQYPDPRLKSLIDDLIVLLSQAQMSDGYLYTYNQILFPDTRWQNLQIEHELYCHGHLIEAGVTHFEVTGRSELLDIAQKAAGRIIEDFRGKGPAWTPGHEEIEIALLRLHQITPQNSAPLEMARQFIEQRGRAKNFPLDIFQQNSRDGKRRRYAMQKRQEFQASHPGSNFQQPPGNLYTNSFITKLRWSVSALSGKYFQQHAPIRKQLVPVGHAVRFAYFETAAAMLVRESGDQSLLPALEQVWEHMVTRRMYVTDGIGSIPGLEGFGRDYELDPQTAYAETCAALACLFWNWEMAQLTGEQKYSDLFEWQLYNAVLVGMGSDGTNYFYNNPLACHGEVTRQPWFSVPCCPSNISRTWANLGKYIFSQKKNRLYIHQYIGCDLKNQSIELPDGSQFALSLHMEAGLPWSGHITIIVDDISADQNTAMFEILLRRPSWSDGMRISINGNSVPMNLNTIPMAETTASGFDPRGADFQSLSRMWRKGDRLKIDFDMHIKLRSAHPKVKGHQNKVAITHGPLVYCLEDVDNPGVDIFTTCIDPASLKPVFDAALGDGMYRINGKTTAGKPLSFIPYFYWGNRGPSQMTVWVNL